MKKGLLVLAFLFSCIVFVNSVSAVLLAPKLISPTKGAPEVSLTPTLDWSSTQGADWYHLYFKKETEISWQYRSTLTESSYTFKENEALGQETTYNWNVRACKGDVETWTAFECEDSVETWSFTTDVPSSYETYQKPCSISATVSTPSDVYVGDRVYTTVRLTNSGDVGGYSDVTAYLCRDDPYCEIMTCDGVAADPRVYVSGGSTYTLTCWKTATQEGYYYIKVDYTDCAVDPVDPTIYSGTFRVRAAPAYCEVDITRIILERDGVDPTTFYLGDNIRVSADVYVTGADPLVTLEMYVDGSWYDSETEDISLGSSERVTFSRRIYTSDYGVTDPTVKVVATADCDPTGDTETKFFSIISRDVTPTYWEGYLDSYRCSGNWRQRLYQYSSGATQWINIEYCDYRCSPEHCLDDPPSNPSSSSNNPTSNTHVSVSNSNPTTTNSPSYSTNSISTSVSASSISTRYVDDTIYVENVHTGNAIYMDEIEVARDISPKPEEVEKAQVWSQTEVKVAWGPIVILALILLSGISIPLVLIKKPRFGRITFRRGKPLEC